MVVMDPVQGFLPDGHVCDCGIPRVCDYVTMYVIACVIDYM